MDRLTSKCNDHMMVVMESTSQPVSMLNQLYYPKDAAAGLGVVGAHMFFVMLGIAHDKNSDILWRVFWDYWIVFIAPFQ